MKLSILALLAAICAFAADATNLVPNASFETLGGDGKLLDWQLPSPPYAVSEESPRTGTRCLKFVNTDPKIYRLASMPVRLETSKSYKFSVWVRGKDLKGKGGGATICVEWMDKDGKHLAGSYPKGVTGTKDEWTLVKGTTRKIPEEAASAHIICYARKGFTGTAWFDDVSLSEYIPPLLNAMVVDRYRNQTAGGKVTAFAGLNLDARNLTAAQVAATIAVLDAKGKTVLGPFPAPIAEETASVAFDSTPLTPGTYTVQIKATVAGETSENSCPITRVATFPERKAYIDGHGRLILDGKPFFPLGMYWGSVKQEHLDLYADSPFNCIMPYSGASKEMLDYAYERDIRFIYSVKDFYAGRGGLKTEEQALAKVRRVVGEKIDHPGIMAWYINDEMPLSMLPQLTAHRDLLEEIDPGRPTWVVLYQYHQVRSYLPTFDVIGTDPYPIPHRPIAHAYQYAKTSSDACFGTRANWMVPQVFNWASYRKGDEKKKYRAPTLDEMKNMTWQCIAGGATGLVYYSWSDLWRMNKSVEDGGRALVPEPFTERWAEVKAMGEEVKRLIPVLLSIEKPVAATIKGENIVHRLFAKDGTTYLLAVNTSREPAKATLTIPATVQILGDELSKTTVAPGTQVDLAFAPLESKMLKLYQH
jgi:hypothetical protein